MRALVLAALVPLAAGCAPAPTPATWHTDVEQALALARTQHAPGVVVQVTAAWCAPCKEFDHDLDGPELRRALADWVMVRLDLTQDSAANDALVERWHVATPTVLFLDPDGRELERLVQYVPPAKLAARIPIRP